MLPQTSANEKFFLIAVCSYFLQRYIKIQYAVIFLRIFKIKLVLVSYANSTSKCKITKCFCKSTPLVLRNSISFLVSH